MWCYVKKKIKFKKRHEKKLLFKYDPIANLYLLKSKIMIDLLVFVKNVEDAIEIRCENHENNNEEITNASFFSENGEVIDLNILIIDKDTPVNQV